jgi:hypothetical protein
MKFIPILFSTIMLQAIIEDRKTQTRRLINPQPNENGISYMKNPPIDWEQVYKTEWKPWKLETDEGETIALNCPYGQIGDVLWVRETFAPILDLKEKPLPDAFIYRADFGDEPVEWNWKPNIFMPKKACRIFLEITNVRVERLRDISEKDTLKEGIEFNFFRGQGVGWKVYGRGTENQMTAIPRISFMSLWVSINGEQSWNDNPWVWAIEFKRIEKPEKFI